MAKRKTIGDNPLDCLIQSDKKNEVEKEVIAGKKEARQNLSTLKQRITVQISNDIIERVKNAVYFTPGLTLAYFAEQAFSKSVDLLEREKPFPQRDKELRTGRPIK
jgi:predicted DNA binding CopG/RHH family protein